MLSTDYRKRAQTLCYYIRNGLEVPIEDMIWIEKLAKANRTVNDMLREARDNKPPSQV